MSAPTPAGPGTAGAAVDPTLRFLGGYPPDVLAAVRAALDDGRVARMMATRYAEPHQIRSDPALYEHVSAIKARHLRNAPVLAKVQYDNRLQIDQRALGTLTAVSRVQGGRLQAKREIRIAAVFRTAPARMLDMIVAHELAHLRHREHDKPFYALCEHLLPDYHQVEFDTRLYLCLRAREAASGAAPA